MLKKPITYTGFDDVEHTEDFYFHLSKSELLKMDAEFGAKFKERYPSKAHAIYAAREGGLAAGLKEEDLPPVPGVTAWFHALVEDDDTMEIIRTVERIIELSYGQKSIDGKHFTKTKEIFQDFYSSAAYDALFMEMTLSEKNASDFVNGVIPKDLRA